MKPYDKFVKDLTKEFSKTFKDASVVNQALYSEEAKELGVEDISLEEAYHILFDEALQRYNDRQKRADRKINNYLEHIQNGIILIHLRMLPA